MRIPQIRMESVKAQIGMEQNMSKIYIQQKSADLTIEQPKANLQMSTTPSKLTIDQSLAFEQMNLKSVRKSIEEQADLGLQSISEGMARRAEQGNELMRIENDGNPIVSQAQINGHKQQKQLGISFIPKPFSVKMHYQPSELTIDVETNRPIIQAQQNKPEISFERGQVNIYMERYEHLDIDFVNLFSETV